MARAGYVLTGLEIKDICELHGFASVIYKVMQC
jgi:hypothetical protein